MWLQPASDTQAGKPDPQCPWEQKLSVWFAVIVCLHYLLPTKVPLKYLIYFVCHKAVEFLAPMIFFNLHNYL